MYNKVLESVEYLKSKISFDITTGIILGSGLGNLTNFIEDKIEIDYSEIPNFPHTTVEGHDGKLVIGTIGGKKVIVMKGRFHFYEGYAMKEVTYPMYVFKMLGITQIIISNAAGGISERFSKGTLMIINDYINLFGTNPLIGPNDERFGPRFPDMSAPFSRTLMEKAKSVAEKLGIKYSEGVYLGTTGPSYETVSEIKMMRTLGADAVGMSTVPEVIVGNYLGFKILGISCITNMATGLATVPHSHEDVVATAIKTETDFCNWIVKIIEEIGE